MRVSRRGLVVALACLSNIGLSNLCRSRLAAAQSSDQVVAERVLGAQWKQLSRRAGMIFAGTVLATAPPPTGPTQNTETVEMPGMARGIPLTFRVDEAIAGVDPGQVLTIYEWEGARDRDLPMRKGQHVLIFLYPPSRLGLTSPVGGSRGQIVLDQAGKNVAELGQKPAVPRGLRSTSRAIRSAREE
jgi:hypothetical protein